jgi:hypothetical protein
MTGIVCHAEVMRYGETQPCHKAAVAYTDWGHGPPWPVCGKHLREYPIGQPETETETGTEMITPAGTMLGVPEWAQTVWNTLASGAGVPLEAAQLLDQIGTLGAVEEADNELGADAENTCESIRSDSQGR